MPKVETKNPLGDTERRFLPLKHARIETRAAADGAEQSVIVGYAAVFYDAADPGTQFELFTDYIERIMPGAFDRAIKEDDCRCLFNHDPSWPLGRNQGDNPTLKLSVDKRGLKYECVLPDTEQGRTVRTAIERGDVSGNSFAMDVSSRTIREEEDVTIREINEVRLFDVGPVTFPAYTGTEVALRSQAKLEAEVKQLRDNQRRAKLRALKLAALTR